MNDISPRTISWQNALKYTEISNNMSMPHQNKTYTEKLIKQYLTEAKKSNYLSTCKEWINNAIVRSITNKTITVSEGISRQSILLKLFAELMNGSSKL